MVIHWQAVIHILYPVRQIPFAAVRHSVTICNKSTWMEFKLKRCHWHRDKLEKRTMRACVEILQCTFIRTSVKVCSELCASIKVNQNLSIVCDRYIYISLYFRPLWKYSKYETRFPVSTTVSDCASVANGERRTANLRTDATATQR